MKLGNPRVLALLLIPVLLGVAGWLWIERTAARDRARQRCESLINAADGDRRQVLPPECTEELLGWKPRP